MRPELKRLILNARARLGGYALSAAEAEENARQQVMDDFERLLTRKISIATSFELRRNSANVWVEDRPAIRFHIDGHTFVLVGAKQECELSEECGGQSLPLARLAISDPQFEDRLLAALGTALEPARQ